MKRRRIAVGVELPLPHLHVQPFFEECTLALGVYVQWGKYRAPETHHVWVEVQLPPVAADALVLVWPSVQCDNRRESLMRLLGRDPDG